ncbi:hypothetical protein KKC13_04110 [bacterium]|nr:hypothetical protein [bacterium]MBU1959298.1 hypothetical protein [bacterium]
MSITLKIDNPNQFEEQLITFVKQQKQNLEELTVEALDNFLNSFQKEEKLVFKKRDPKKYSRKIEYIDEENEDLSDVKPYSHIEDSGQYIHDLRRQRKQ